MPARVDVLGVMQYIINCSILYKLYRHCRLLYRGLLLCMTMCMQRAILFFSPAGTGFTGACVSVYICILMSLQANKRVDIGKRVHVVRLLYIYFFYHLFVYCVGGGESKRLLETGL